VKYRKKPVVIEAVQWKGDNAIEVFAFVGIGRIDFTNSHLGELSIDTLEGVMRASKGDFIIRGVEGELYPCKPEIFAATYEEVSDTTDNDIPQTPPSKPFREMVRAVCQHGKMNIYQCKHPWCIAAVAGGGYCVYESRFVGFASDKSPLNSFGKD